MQHKFSGFDHKLVAVHKLSKLQLRPQCLVHVLCHQTLAYKTVYLSFNQLLKISLACIWILINEKRSLDIVKTGVFCFAMQYLIIKNYHLTVNFHTLYQLLSDCRIEAGKKYKENVF